MARSVRIRRRASVEASAKIYAQPVQHIHYNNQHRFGPSKVALLKLESAVILPIQGNLSGKLLFLADYDSVDSMPIG